MRPAAALAVRHLRSSRPPLQVRFVCHSKHHIHSQRTAQKRSRLQVRLTPLPPD